MVKVLVTGDVFGKCETLFGRIKKLQAKGQNFTCVFCVGSFFPNDGSACPEWDEYKTGAKPVPITTYILGPSNVAESKFYAGMDNGGELCDNVVCLGRCGIYKSAEGLRISYLSGSANADDLNENYKVQANAASKLKSMVGKETVDMFLTSAWPLGISNLGNCPDDPKLLEAGNVEVARSSREIKPRYHFAGSEGKHYERRPYKNKDLGLKVTRFVALAAVGNAEKEKYLYAFNINPGEETNKVPEDCTESPFPDEAMAKHKAAAGSYRWALPDGPNLKEDVDDPDAVERRKRQMALTGDGGGKRQRREQGDCWFCLGGEHVRKHMVVSVGQHCYLALARGGVNSQHVLILPIQHHQSSLTIPDEVQFEVEEYKKALREMFKARGLATFIYERNYKTDHMQIQVIPIHKKYKAHIPASLEKVGQGRTDRNGYPIEIDFNELPMLVDMRSAVPGPRTPFFVCELEDGTRLLHRVRGGFPLNYGREAVCELINKSEKGDWKNCVVSDDMEEHYAVKFREIFEKFDPFLEQDSDSDDDETPAVEN